MTTHASTTRPRARLDAERAVHHRDRLYRCALALTGDRDEAEDLVQDVLETLLRRPPTLRDGQSERAYLLAMVRNRHIDTLRVKRRRPQVPLDDVGDLRELRTGDEPHARAEHRAVLAAVAQLARHHREVLVAVDVAGLGYAEAAAALGVPVGTVMSRLYRARANVMAALGAVETRVPVAA